MIIKSKLYTEIVLNIENNIEIIPINKAIIKFSKENPTKLVRESMYLQEEGRYDLAAIYFLAALYQNEPAAKIWSLQRFSYPIIIEFQENLSNADKLFNSVVENFVI